MSETPEQMSGPTPQTQAVSMLELIRDHFRFLVVFTLAGTVLVGAYSLVMRHTYEASAKIIATETKSSSISAMLSGLPAIISGGAGASSGSQSMSEILSSRTNAEYIISKCHLDTLDAFKNLSPQERVDAVLAILNVDSKRSSGVMVVQADLQTSFFPSSDEQHRTAELSALICNTAIEGLDKENREKSTSTARKTRMYIERVLASNKLKLDSLQTSMIAFQNEHHIFTPEKQAEAMVSSDISIGTELAKAETELRLAREQYQDNTPMVAALESKVAGLRQQYLNVQSGGLSGGDQLTIPIDVLPKISMGYLNLVRDIKILEQVNAYLESQRMQEAIQEEKDVPTIQIIDPAVPLYKRAAPARVLMVIVGCVVSAFLGVFVLIFRRTVQGLRHMLAAPRHD